MPARAAAIPDPFAQRRAGLLLHPTSLPGPGQQGIIGHEAFRLIEWMAAAGLSVWQTLPLGPTHGDRSPYNALSAHAIDPALISLDWLRDRKLLSAQEAQLPQDEALHLAFAHFQTKAPVDMAGELERFSKTHRIWLHDYALFMAIRNTLDRQSWLDWPDELRDRDSDALQSFKQNYATELNFHIFCQSIAHAQWTQLKHYANRHGVLLFGDIPIYVALDSADVWSHRDLFQLDKSGHPTRVAGVPPDYFSATGQRWGNPLYRWSAMKADRFHWWQQRIQSQLGMFDLMRIDHFRGLQAYWQIPAQCDTAIEGKWVKAPGKSMLCALRKHYGRLPLVAEDLGIITEEVTQLRESFHLPGMKILQFAFDGNPDNAYLPHNHTPLSVVYTGTHDNDTSESWYEGLSQEMRDYIDSYLGPGFPNESISHRMVRTALSSSARLAMLPLQDILGLGQGHRMNTPGTIEGNWNWRFEWQQIDDVRVFDLRQLNKTYARLVHP